MNKARRKELDKLRDKLEEVKSELEMLANAERDSYDNMPESLQQGERGTQSEAAADALDNAVSSLDDAISSVDEAVS